VELSRIFKNANKLHAFSVDSRLEEHYVVYIISFIERFIFTRPINAFLDFATSLLVVQSSLFVLLFHVCYKDLVSCIWIKFWRTEEKLPLVAMLVAFNIVVHTVDSIDDY